MPNPEPDQATVAAIVAWLRTVGAEPASPEDTGQALARKIAAFFFADAIERGEAFH